MSSSHTFTSESVTEGHFGRSEQECPWEATPRVDELRSALGC